jgi:hypothetical protein
VKPETGFLATFGQPKFQENSELAEELAEEEARR